MILENPRNEENLRNEEFSGPMANRLYKSTMFAMVFHQKPELLELYNAVNKTTYDNPELLQFNTLKNAIYMAMCNDVSFIIDSMLGLYEHQSTHNPNLPLRYLMYTADLYSVMTRDENLYGTKMIGLPTPQFITFYNGEQEMPDSMELKLSDAFTVKKDLVSLELKVTVLNINSGHNEELRNACRTLRDYSEYTERVRKYAKMMSLDEAVERSITECIREGILADFLLKNRAEAKKVSIYEYDQEKHMRQEREASFAEGKAEGKADAVLELLGELSEVPEALKERIRSQTDLFVLQKWLKLAAKAESIEEFERQI